MLWEPAVRAPLIIQAGGKFGQNRAELALTEFVDLVPTALQALQVAPLNGIHGKSLFPILENTKKKHRDAVFSEYLVDNKAMIRTTKWKYVFNTGKADLGLGYATGNPPSGILHQLYDLENDPNETHNVAAQPANKKELLKLQKKMLDVFRETHHYAASIAASLSTDEQLAAFCEPPENRKK